MNKFIIIFILFYFNFAFSISIEQEDFLMQMLLFENDNEDLTKLNPTPIISDKQMILDSKIPVEDVREFFHKKIIETKYDKTFKDKKLHFDSVIVDSSIYFLQYFGDENSLKILRTFWEDTDIDNLFKSTAIYSSIEISNFDKNLIIDMLNKEYIGDTFRYYSIANQIFERYKKMQEEKNVFEQIRLLKILKVGSEMPYSKEKFLHLLDKRNMNLTKIAIIINDLEKNLTSKISKIDLEKAEIIKNSKETENQDSIKTENSSSISLNAGNSKSNISIIFGVLFTIVFGGFFVCERKKKNRK